MNIPKIIKQINNNEHICDNCGKPGDMTNMRLKIGVGIFHAKCKTINKLNLNQ